MIDTYAGRDNVTVPHEVEVVVAGRRAPAELVQVVAVAGLAGASVVCWSAVVVPIPKDGGE